VPWDKLKQAAFMAEIGTIELKPTSRKGYFFAEAWACREADIS
jgi:hypothetical protein